MCNLHVEASNSDAHTSLLCRIRHVKVIKLSLVQEDNLFFSHLVNLYPILETLRQILNVHIAERLGNDI